jgi:hypothetical protein
VGQLCDSAVGHCVDCVVDTDCPSDFVCSADVCVASQAAGGSTGAGGTIFGTGGLGGGGFVGMGGQGAGGIAGTGGLGAGGVISTGGAIGGGGINAGGSSGPGGSMGAGGSGGFGGQCATSSVTAQEVPLDIYVLFDQSLSMNDSVTGGTKWNAMTGALTTFVQSSASNGTSIGIGYFPLVVPNAPTTCTVDTDCGSFGPCESTQVCTKADACLASNYAPEVPIATLPGVATAIVGSLNAHSPNGYTPTYPALQGSYQYVTSFAQAHKQDNVILVLATDGDPTTCNANTNNVNSIATNLVAPALAGTPKIMTFVVGIGSSLTSLNQIAQSGGSQQAFIVDTAGADPGGQFLAILKAIRGSVLLGCQYEIPTPASGPLDPSKVNLQLLPTGGSPTLIKQVPAASACNSTAGGWYYDNPSAPTRIILCNSTCTAVNSTAGTSVAVALGCPTIQ